MRGLFDTHILLDYLKGLSEAAAELDRYEKRFISAISVVELQMAVGDETQLQALKQFLGFFEIVALDEIIATEAVQLKKKYRELKLPHACIWASARMQNALLVTRNVKRYPVTEYADIRVPY